MIVHPAAPKFCRSHSRSVKANEGARTLSGSPASQCSRSTASLGRAVTLLRVLGQGFQADQLEVAVHARFHLARGIGFALENTCNTVSSGVSAWNSAGRSAARRGSRPGVDVHRGGRAPSCRPPAPGPCSAGVPRMAPVCVRPLSPSSRLARPKSVTCGWPSRVEQDVGRLEVAVEDAALVGVVDRPGDRRPPAGRGRAGRRRSRPGRRARLPPSTSFMVK